MYFGGFGGFTQFPFQKNHHIISKMSSSRQSVTASTTELFAAVANPKRVDMTRPRKKKTSSPPPVDTNDGKNLGFFDSLMGSCYTL